MRLIDRLMAIASVWASVNDRSLATLASRAANDGKLFDRISNGGKPTIGTFEMVVDFLAEPTNWREGVIPPSAAEIIATIPPYDGGRGNRPSASTASCGKVAAVSARAAA